ncbi:hypothetical protein WN48_00850 [Eufriesea mexicana]|nr:hypothetical protein WN48_00850 [Eufriesea mexicana]
MRRNGGRFPAKDKNVDGGHPIVVPTCMHNRRNSVIRIQREHPRLLRNSQRKQAICLIGTRHGIDVRSSAEPEAARRAADTCCESRSNRSGIKNNHPAVGPGYPEPDPKAWISSRDELADVHLNPGARPSTRVKARLQTPFAVNDVSDQAQNSVFDFHYEPVS